MDANRTAFIVIHGWFDVASVSIHVGINGVAAVLNALLIYFILFRTPSGLKTYSVLLFNSAATELLACFVALFLMQRIIPLGTTLSYISHGPCGLFGHRVCFWTYSTMLHCYAHSIYSLPLSFGYRAWVLLHPAPRMRSMVLITLGVYSLTAIMLFGFPFSESPQEVVVEILRKNFPQYDLRGTTVSGNANIFEFWILYTILYMTLPWMPVYGIIIYLRRKVYTALAGSALMLSEQTKETHKTLVKILSIQATLPAFLGLAVVSYAIGQLNIYHHPILEEATFHLVGFVPLFSPLITLYYFRPYRRILSKWLGVGGKSLKSKFYRPSNSISHINTTSASRAFDASDLA